MSFFAGNIYLVVLIVHVKNDGCIVIINKIKTVKDSKMYRSSFLIALLATAA